jgi:hypothetical protein
LACPADAQRIPGCPEQIGACRNPLLSVEKFLVAFKKTVPRFVEAVRDSLV